MRKNSKAKKFVRKPVNVLAWTEVISRSSSYQDCAKERGEHLVAKVRTHAANLYNGSTQTEAASHDEVIHALATARIRAFQIAGPNNPAETTLMAGIQAVNHAQNNWRTTAKWFMTEEEKIQLCLALDVYETILMASSPRQMEEALKIHLRQLTDYLAKIA